MVPMTSRAWHLGRGRLGDLSVRADRKAVGIEISNPGPLDEDGDSRFIYTVGRTEKLYDHKKFGYPVRGSFRVETDEGELVELDEGWWAPYSEDQISTLVELCAQICLEYDVPLNHIVGHEDACTPAGRKTDPGPLFPWGDFMTRLADRLGVEVPEDVFEHHRAV